MWRRIIFWKFKDFQEIEAKLAARLDSLFSKDEKPQRLVQIVHDLNIGSHKFSPQERFVHALAALKLDSELGLLGAKNRHDLLILSESLLKQANIDQKNSRLSHLLGELYLVRSDNHGVDGEHFLSAWQATMADVVTYRAEVDISLRSLRIQRQKMLRLGNAGLASAMYKLTTAKDDDEKDGRNEYVQLLLLTGAIDEALSAVSKMTSDSEEARWVRAVLGVVKTQDYDAFTSWILEQSLDLDKTLRAKLLIAASRQRSFDRRLPKIDTIRRKYKKDEIEAKNLGTLIKALKSIEDCYDMEVPLRDRLESLGESLTERRKLPDILSEVLFLVAANRVLTKFSQPSLLQLVTAEYESLSLRLSQGSKKDILDMLRAGLSDTASITVPRGQVGRAGQLALMAARGVGIWTSSRARRVFAAADQSERLRGEELEKLSHILAETFGRLKGGMMKVGQILSLITDISPKFVNPLRRMNLVAERSENHLINEIIRDQLGDSPENIFDEWNPDPIAIGSVGQVYKARLKSGQVVCVKVQHPGVEESLESDLKLLRVIKPMIRRFFPMSDSSAIYDEIRARLLSELDYELEVKNQEAFRNLFEGHSGILVPRVFSEYSRKKIITTEYVDGLSFDVFVRTASQSERNNAGRNIVDAFLRSIWPHGLFNCDPHPNNYVFLDGGRIALLDFGCVRHWNSQFVNAWGSIILSAIDGDVDACHRAWIESGGYKSDQPIDRQMLLSLSRTMCEPVITDTSYTFTHDFVRRNSDSIYLANTKLKKFFSPPPESTMMMRFAWGLYSVLADLAATNNWHRIVRTHLIDVMKPADNNTKINVAS